MHPTDTLQSAIIHEDLALIREILKANLHLATMSDETGWTPWERARDASPAVLDAFLDSGVDIDWADEQGRTLALIVAEDGQDQVLAHLLARGASLRPRGCNVVRAAIRNANLNCLGVMMRSKEGLTPTELQSTSDISAQAAAMVLAHQAAQHARAALSDLRESKDSVPIASIPSSSRKMGRLASAC